MSDPEWFPAHWGRGRDIVRFVHLPREQHAQLTFLADEYIGPLELKAASATIAELRGTEAPAVPPPQYIFHSAFAASTVLARALDVPGVVMGLKEPAILNELAEAMRSNSLPATPWRRSSRCWRGRSRAVKRLSSSRATSRTSSRLRCSS